ncbi:AAA family ATPase [Pseudomonas sp. PS02290]|uniref:AAA family ATPase n=1 Tax=Pseudomonas sp. PS02290 TaxID=2991430 RepID=UPI00249B8CCD|nr:AAA family ATPase [Pseudomonas sp. PS02290]
MLERIERIQGIGLLHDVDGKALKLSSIQLIYADNGRGKSTLASVLRSVSTGDVSTITERKTVDRNTPPAATLTFGSGHKVTFKDGSWSEQRPELLVFDAEFIEKNVHSGGVVTPGQRKNLLQFALGASAVKAQAAEDQATKSASAANAAVAQITAQLAGYHQGMLLPAFIRLKPAAELETQPLVNDLRKRIQVAQNIGVVMARPLPAEITEPMFDIDSLFTILNTSLKDVEENAEQIVSQHFKKPGYDNIEKWVSDGLRFDDGSTCPYCSQSTDGVSLIKAYRTHFNKKYEELKSKVSVLERGVLARTSDSVIDTLDVALATSNAALVAWSVDHELPQVTFDRNKAKEDITTLRTYLLSLVGTKLNKPLEPIGDDAEKLFAKTQWQNVLSHIQNTNSQVRDARKAIENYRASLQSENIGMMNQSIINLELAVSRGKAEVTDLITSLAAARQKAVDAETLKKTARAALVTHMSETLKTFQKSINTILLKFGASFSIEKMDANFRGGARSEYGLSLRGMSITLDGTPRFSTALSEGDKRTLAFAFFVATVAADTELKDKVVVIDDPMCSLDANRKAQTIGVLKTISGKAEQIVILAHDPFFIRDLRDKLTAKGAPALQILQLQHSVDGYSDLAKFDPDKECESPFYRHHRLIMELSAGISHDNRTVAQAIRPFLEGYLHRRFPGLIPRDLMFGQIVGHIAAAQPNDPLYFAHGLLEELQEINSYSGQFHHDTNPGLCETIPVVTSELISFGQRALTLVYRGAA